MSSVAGAHTAEPRDKVTAARRWRGPGGAARFASISTRDAGPPARGPSLLAPLANAEARTGGIRARPHRDAARAGHIEFGAIDLAVDMAGRFGAGFPRRSSTIGSASPPTRRCILAARPALRTLGAAYGALPAHGGLWEAAEATADDPLARLAVVPMVLEARGLDDTRDRGGVRSGRGRAVGAILGRIYHDEIRHVAAGTHWFGYGCKARGLAVVAHWQRLIRSQFRGS